MKLEMLSLVAALCPLFITALPAPLIASNGVGTIGLPFCCFVNPTPVCECGRYPNPSPGLLAPGLNEQQQFQQLPVGGREEHLGASELNLANSGQLQDTRLTGNQRQFSTSTLNTVDRISTQQNNLVGDERNNLVLPEQQLPLQQSLYQNEGSLQLNNQVDQLQQNRLASIGQQDLVIQPPLEEYNAPVCPQTPCCTNAQLANSQICLSEVQKELLRQQLQSIIGTNLDVTGQSVAVLPVVMVPQCQQAVLMPLCQPACSVCPSQGIQQYSPQLVSPSDYTQVPPVGLQELGPGAGLATGPGIVNGPGLATGPGLANRPLLSGVNGGNRNNLAGLNQPGISNPVSDEYLGNRQRIPGAGMRNGLQGANSAPLNRWSPQSGNRPMAQRDLGESVPAADGSSSSEETEPSSQASGESESNKDVRRGIPATVPQANTANAIASSKATAQASSAGASKAPATATALSSANASAKSA